MINVHFNTDNLSTSEKHGLVFLLQALLPAPSEQPVPEIAAEIVADPQEIRRQMEDTIPEPEKAQPEKPRRGRPRKESAIEQAPSEQTAEDQQAQPAHTAEFTRALAEYNDAMDVAGVPADKRKAAVDIWTAKPESELPALKDALAATLKIVEDRKAALTAAPAPEPEKAAPSTGAAPTLDDLRNALQTYTEKHDMKAGIELLKDFGVQRVSEIQNLDVEAQREFVKLATANA